MSEAASQSTDTAPSLMPHLIVKDGERAIEWYQLAFGADLVHKTMSPDGSLLMNATLRINGQSVMLGAEMPQMRRWVSAEQLGGTSVGLHLVVEDVDSAFERALAAGGCEVMMEPADQFWGDRYCQFFDPFGHAWALARPLGWSEEQKAEAFKQFMQRMQGQG